MSKTIKYWQLCLMAILAMAFSACTEEYEYDPTTDTATTGAYMEATTETSIILTEDDAQQLSFTVLRHDSTTAATYKLYTDYDEMDIPETVSFTAGEKSKTITASFNVPSGTVQKKIVIGIDSADTYTYGAHSLTFVISRLKKISDCQIFATGGVFTGAALWNMDIYEYGKVVENGAVVSTSYLVKDPYASDDIGLPEDCIGKGNQFTFTLTPDGKATMGSGTNSLFYCSASFTGDASVVGDLIISGTGTYYASPVELTEGFTASNFVLFNWESRIGTTGYGFGTCTHAVIFPEGYDPLTQTSK